MITRSASPRRHALAKASWLVLATATLLARWALAPRGMHEAGLAALRDGALAIAFWLTVVGIAYGLGRGILHWLALPSLTGLETVILSLALGFGLLGWTVFALGMAEVLTRAAILALLISGSLLAAGPMSEVLIGSVAWSTELRTSWKHMGTIARLILGASLLIGAMAFANALTPPWDYDGLMYHLVGPRLWLEGGKIYPYPDNWYVNGPSLLEMVFALGMAFGDDLFPKLVHFSMGMLFVLASYAMARRWSGRDAAWLTVAILLGIPVLAFLGSFAYIDFGWSLFEFLALAMAVHWALTRDSWRTLAASGLFAGLGASSKYLGLIGFGLIGLYLLGILRHSGLRRGAFLILAFALPAFVIAAPWYLRNFLWFGNPVFPLYFGGHGFDTRRLELYSAYLDSFGAGKAPLDFLLLPLRVYTHHAQFGAVMNRNDFPSILFPLVFFYPFSRRKTVLDHLLGVSLGRAVLWAFGSQQIRFLLPIYPVLALTTAHMVVQLSDAMAKLRKPWHLFLPALSFALMFLTLFYGGTMWGQIQPHRVLLGIESRQDFLLRSTKDYSVLRYLNEKIAPGGRALLLGDGRGYYCVPRCLPDPDHFRWAGEIAGLPDSQSLEGWFHERGITHVMISWEDVNFLFPHDATQVLQAAMARLEDYAAHECLRELIHDESASLYEVGCNRE